jgi:hypothetical protein
LQMSLVSVEKLFLPVLDFPVPCGDNVIKLYWM